MRDGTDGSITRQICVITSAHLYQTNLFFLVLCLGKVFFCPLQLVLQPVDLILEFCLLILVEFLHGDDLHDLFVILCSPRLQLLFGLLQVSAISLNLLNKNNPIF